MASVGSIVNIRNECFFLGSWGNESLSGSRDLFATRSDSFCHESRKMILINQKGNGNLRSRFDLVDDPKVKMTLKIVCDPKAHGKLRSQFYLAYN